jgi:hypothetical protein
MTISFPIDFPNNDFAQVQWQEVSSISASASPFNFATQVFSWGGETWRVAVSLRNMDRSEFGQWSAFLSALRGPEGTFRCGSELQKIPLGTAVGTPVIDVTSIAGDRVLSTSGWGVSQVVLQRGDLFQVGNSLYKVLADVTSDGSGVAEIDVWPSSRGHASGASIVTSSPKGLFRLESGSVGWNESETRLMNLSFAGIEAL